MTPISTDLPYVDEHAIRVEEPPEQVWFALQRYVATSLDVAEGSRLARVLRTEPRAGFEMVESKVPERLVLGGRHRFSRYVLAFELANATGGATQLRAQTYAAFPGVSGQLYRTLVIGTGAHTIATRHVLRSIRRLSVQRASG
jgi:hypothetical protein